MGKILLLHRLMAAFGRHEYQSNCKKRAGGGADTVSDRVASKHMECGIMSLPQNSKSESDRLMAEISFSCGCLIWASIFFMRFA